MNFSISGDIDAQLIGRYITKRNLFISKNDCGRVLLVAGGAGMTGSAVLGAKATLRSGVGLAYVCTPKGNFQVIQTCVPEAICAEWSAVADRDYDAVAFGPGMGKSTATKRMLKNILLSNTSTLIIDADGLNVLAEDDELQNFAANYMGDLIVTPHLGEAKRLLNAERNGNPDGRMEMAFELATKFNAVAVLKGAGTLVAGDTGEVDGMEIWQNTTGNPGMATAGSGDVLTGVILALAGQGLSGLDAARAGVYIHGLAGDLACRDKGEYGMIAGDIAEEIPYAIKSIIAE